MKSLIILPLVALLSVPSLALAQGDPDKKDNVLTPTDVLEAAQVSLLGAFRIGLGTAEVTNDAADASIDVDTRSFDLFFEAGVGLGRGFEIVASIPYEIQGTMEGETDILEYEVESYSVGDLTLQGVYRILKEDKSTPQWVVAAIVVAPTGYWKEAEGELRSGGTVVFPGDKGGIGGGIWRYGLGSAISKRFGAFEPYLGGAYLFGDETSERGHARFDRPDIGQLFLGAELHISPEAALDIRGQVEFIGKEVTDRWDDGSMTWEDTTEESHQAYILTAQLYARVVPGVTITLGGGVYTVQDHILNKDVLTGPELELEGHFAFVLQMGIQWVLGGM